MAQPTSRQTMKTAGFSLRQRAASLALALPSLSTSGQESTAYIRADGDGAVITPHAARVCAMPPCLFRDSRWMAAADG
jgi:hypothetical protein